MKPRSKKKLFKFASAFSFLFFLWGHAGIAENVRTTPLESLSARSGNTAFRQFMREVEKSFMDIAAGITETAPRFYTYTAAAGDTLFSLSARCNILYDTIATLNRISDPNEQLDGRELLIPSASGLFIPDSPQSDLELLLDREYPPQENDRWYTINGTRFRHIQKGRFSSTDRAFFLDTSMTMPLEKSILTSPFGFRTSPISGEFKFHQGVDLAAPSGTPVLSCKAGKIETILQNDPIYGNCIIIDHGNQMKSIYAHLSKIEVVQNDRVAGGNRIGQVGTTGASTGPHLHFEIRIGGNAQDPAGLLTGLN